MSGQNAGDTITVFSEHCSPQLIFSHTALSGTRPWSGLGVVDLAIFHIVLSKDSHFHLLSLLICNPHLISLKPTVHKGEQSLIGGDGARSYR